MIHSVRRLLGYQKQQCSFAVSMDFILAHGTLGIITTAQATSIRMFIINIIYNLFRRPTVSFSRIKTKMFENNIIDFVRCSSI